MLDEFRIIEKRILTDDKILYLHAEGTVTHYIVNNKLRILMVFQVGRRQRRIPVEAVCFTKDEKCYFEMHTKILFETVFQPFSIEEAKLLVQVFFEYCDSRGEWHVLPEKLELDGEYFLETKEKHFIVYQGFRYFLYMVLTLLLPLWILDGWFVIKGYKKSPYLGKEKGGKKGMFYHAHGLVKEMTGFGYSMREMKTGYFLKCYKKECKRCKKTEGILLLSERLLEKGGNLDVIREGLQEKGIPYQEFIDTRPIHKLPFAEIRKSAKLAARAKVIVLEDFYPQINMAELRSETKLVQLWHACGAFKMFGLSELGKVEHLEQNTRNHRNYSYAFVSGEKMVPFYAEAFGLSPQQVLPLGVPRTDVFFDRAYKEKIVKSLHQKYPILRGKRVVLFAPTFRGSGNKTAYYPRERFIVDTFVEEMPADTVFIIKNHPFVKERFICSEKFWDRVIDLTDVENINDLLFLASVLITDYSSCIFEASLLNIPTIFYVFDLEEYIEERDFYFDFSSFAPGVKVRTFETLLEEIKQILSEEYRRNSKEQEVFKQYFLSALDGHSAERVLKKIIDLTEGKGEEDVSGL